MADARHFAGRTAVVTGGSRGIGRAIALAVRNPLHHVPTQLTTLQLAHRGISKLAITYNTSDTTALVAELKSLGVAKVAAIQASLLSPTYGADLIAATLAQLSTNTIDILVNNAALIDPSTFEPLLSTTLSGFTAQFQANVFAPISLSNALLPYLPASDGRVINVSSILAKSNYYDPTIVHGASKAALDAITQGYACSVAREKGCTFNVVTVGPTDTEGSMAMANAMSNSQDEAAKIALDMFEAHKKETTVGHRFAKPDEVANIVCFLAGRESGWINGAVIPAHGGWKPLTGH